MSKDSSMFEHAARLLAVVDQAKLSHADLLNLNQEYLPILLEAIKGERMLSAGEFKAILECAPGSWLEPILHPAVTIVLPKQATSFVARTEFSDGFLYKTLLQIGQMSTSFTDRFLCGKGKIENAHNLHSGALYCYQIREDSPHSRVIQELGGLERSLVTLWEMHFALVGLQKFHVEDRSESNGDDRGSNVFRVRGVDNEPCIVEAFWCGDGWHLSARPISDSFSLGSCHWTYSSSNNRMGDFRLIQMTQR